jgi:2-C-methyl-D-erythritol 4-phosphate cytidylyltransferase
VDAPAYWLVVPAAGSGRRMAAGATDCPKQYRRLAAATLIEQALAPFLADHRCQGVVVALADGDSRWRELPFAHDPRIATVTGGRERRDSVAAGLATVAARTAAADPWVLVHDAARPCVSRAEIDALLAALATSPDGALLGLPVSDTLKRATADLRVASTVSRDGVWRALTPQAFRLRRLQAALAAGGTATDEAGAVEALGDRPRLVAGSPFNIKVTEPADLLFAAQLLSGGVR